MDDRPEGVLQNERDNSGLAVGGVFEAREEYCFLRIAFMVMCHRTVWNDDKPEKVVRSGAGYS